MSFSPVALQSCNLRVILPSPTTLQHTNGGLKKFDRRALFFHCHVCRISGQSLAECPQRMSHGSSGAPPVIA